MERQHKAFLFLDFLFCILPVLMMVVIALEVSHTLLSNFENQVKEQILMDKLLSISDYVVRYSAAERSEEYYFPNKLSKSEFSSDVSKLKDRMNLEYLYIGFEEGEGNCIYRIVLYNNEIKKLYLCGR